MKKSIGLQQTFKKRKSLRKYVGLLYISPWIIGLIILTIYPLFTSFFYSFTDYNMVSDYKLIGLKNYKNILTNDPIFNQSLKVTLTYVLIAVPGKLIFSLFIAMILNQRLKGINF